MAVDPIQIEGLKEFRRSLKSLDQGLPKALRVGLNAAVSIVVKDAQPRVPQRTGRAAGSIRAQSTQGQARIKAGGGRVPYFPWLDFGGNRAGRGGGVAKRPFYKQGRYIWAAFGDRRGEVLAELETAVADVARQAGLEVTTTHG